MSIEGIDNSPQAVKGYCHEHVGGAGDAKSLAKLEYLAESI